MGMFLMVNYTTKFIKEKDSQYISYKETNFIVSIHVLKNIYLAI